MSTMIPGTAGGVVLPGAQQSPTFDPMEFARTMAQLKQNKQQTAMQTLHTMMDMAQQGINIDPKEMEKTAITAGIHPGTGLPEPPKTGDQGQPLPAGVTPAALAKTGSAMGGGTSGAAAAVDVSKSAASKNPAGGKTPDPMQNGQGMFESFVANARSLAQQKNMNAQQQEGMVRIMLNLKQKAMEGDNEALGQLQRIDPVNNPFNPELELWNDPVKGPDVKAAKFAQLTGQETKEQKDLRIQKQSQEAVLNGRFQDVNTARGFFEGTSNVVPNMTADDRMKQSDAFKSLLEAGVPVDAARKAATAVGAGANMWDAIPSTFIPYAKQQMDIKKQEAAAQTTSAQASMIGAKAEQERVGIEKTRAEIDLEQAKAAGQRALIDLQKTGNEALKQKLDFLIDSKYRGLTVPTEMQNSIENELAESLGAHLQEDSGMIRSGIRWLTGDLIVDKHMTVVPNEMNDMSRFTGGAQGTSPKPFAMPKINRSKLTSDEQKANDIANASKLGLNLSAVAAYGRTKQKSTTLPKMRP